MGDQLTLIAAAHLLLRPIVLITDSESEVDTSRDVVINPPDIIAEECWGPPIVLV